MQYKYPTAPSFKRTLGVKMSTADKKPVSVKNATIISQIVEIQSPYAKIYSNPNYVPALKRTYIKL